MVDFWLSLYCAAILLPIVWADGNDHIHIKLHLPELRKKHTHVKTVYKHHFHPKKITHSFGNKIELDGSYSMLNPLFTLPKAGPYSQFELPSTSWLPEKVVVDPPLKPQFKPLSLNNNWPTKNSFLRYLQAQKQFHPQVQAEMGEDYSSDGKFSEDVKNYDDDDDEDEEYTMTEDSINEQPLALQMQLGNSARHESASRLNSGTQFSGPIGFPSSQAENLQWTQHLNNGNYFTESEIEDMQHYQNYKNMQQLQANSDFEPVFTTMKSTKPTNKGRNKKRKRLNANKKVNNNFGYTSH